MTDKEFTELMKLLKAVECKAVDKEQPQDVKALLAKAMFQQSQEDVEEQARLMGKKCHG